MNAGCFITQIAAFAGGPIFIEQLKQQGQEVFAIVWKVLHQVSEAINALHNHYRTLKHGHSQTYRGGRGTDSTYIAGVGCDTIIIDA